VQAATVGTSSWNELVVITTKEFKPIKGRIELAIVFCTLPLSIKFMEVLVVVVNTQVEALEKTIIPKPIPLVIQEIGVGTYIILIDNITHAFEVFKTLDTVLKDTPIIEGLKFQLVPLAEPIDTIGE
jgi:hypothetical protein